MVTKRFRFRRRRCSQALEEQRPELVITDLHLENSRAQGLDILRKARSLNPPAEVVVITAFGSVETAVEAMKQGAYDYLEKPFKVDEFKLCARRALSYNHAVAENQFLKKQLREKFQFNQDHRSRPEDAGSFPPGGAGGRHRQHDPDPG
jgi:DNA-binding NtrC family response regulator